MVEMVLYSWYKNT